MHVSGLWHPTEVDEPAGEGELLALSQLNREADVTRPMPTLEDPRSLWESVGKEEKKGCASNTGECTS